MLRPYLEFLLFSVSDELTLPKGAKDVDWEVMLQWAEEQAIVGVIYDGIQKAGKSLNIPFDILMEWIGYASLIEAQNRVVNDRCIKIVEQFKNVGYHCWILKGQGNAMMYPQPLLRTPGDIDVYVLLKDKKEQKELIRYVRMENPHAKACYHHIDYGLFGDVEVEVHYRPSFLNNLMYNYRLQKWFECHTENTEITEMPEEAGSIRIPNWEFNVVFQLAHIYNHIIHEGIGLRQIIDYYYLLKNEERRVKNEESSISRTIVLEHLGLTKIAGAVMWVLKEVLGLEERYLIAPVDERRGRFLQNEILLGGNFGQYDNRVNRQGGQLNANINRLKRDVRLVRYFPSECLWEPVFRLWHYFWRVTH